MDYLLITVRVTVPKIKKKDIVKGLSGYYYYLFSLCIVWFVEERKQVQAKSG